MEDAEIVDLYWKRDESAIQETESKYSHYLMKIAYNVLENLEDSKESVNDTYLKAWNSIPPHIPEVLSAYLGKITRQTAIDIYRKRNSGKRRPSQYQLSLSELEESFATGETVEEQIELQELAKAISTYLRTLSEESRNAFVCRYYFMDSIKAIAGYIGGTQAKTKSMLFRVRNGLRDYLVKEGFLYESREDK